MTGENIRANAADEMGLAETSIKAARLLLEQNLLPDAASRVYYAAFHAARALLFSEGVESRSHRALRTLFSRHFVQTGRLPAAFAKELAQLEALRAAGDYDPAFSMEASDIQPEYDKALRLVETARSMLLEQGIIDDE